MLIEVPGYPSRPASDPGPRPTRDPRRGRAGRPRRRGPQRL